MGSAGTAAAILLVAGLIVFPLAIYLIFRSWNARRSSLEIGDARAGVERLLKQTELNASGILKQAERDAEALRKEAALAAREKAHEIAAEADRELRERRQEILTLEQAVADKTRSLADRLTETDRREQELSRQP